MCLYCGQEATMKKVLMLGTGGTIASEVTPSGLAPALTSAELLRCVP